MQTDTINEFESGLFKVVLEPCTNAVLPVVLNPNIPFVWCLRHLPNPRVEWWLTDLPLSRTGKTFSVQARDVSFDFMLETKRYLELIDEFMGQGNLLIQSRKRMPESLHHFKLSDKNRYSVLKLNGFYLEFGLPHADEYATVITTDAEHLKSVVENYKTLIGYHG